MIRQFYLKNRFIFYFFGHFRKLWHCKKKNQQIKYLFTNLSKVLLTNMLVTKQTEIMVCFSLCCIQSVANVRGN